jgi:hypothetical protein
VSRRVINIEVWLAVAVMTFAVGLSVADAQEQAAPTHSTGGQTTPATTESAPPTGWRERDTFTGNWGGGRTWLKAHGFTLEPRLTQFYQGMPSGDGDHSFEYGAKTDAMFHSDFGKLGLWKGFSMTVHAEYNFGSSDTVPTSSEVHGNSPGGGPFWKPLRRDSQTTRIPMGQHAGGHDLDAGGIEGIQDITPQV